MQIMLLAVLLAAPADADYPPSAPRATAVQRRQAPWAVACPNYSPPARWFCKRCAGCAGGNCLSTQQPYIGSVEYNYRVQFDYPWSMRPAYAMEQFAPHAEILEEVPVDGEPIETPNEAAPRELSSRKPRTALRR